MRAVALCLVLTACNEGLDPADASHECSFWFRATVESQGSDEEEIPFTERVVVHETDGDGEAFTIGDFDVTTTYFESAYDGHALSVSVAPAGTQRRIVSQLFQFGETVRDQFAGEHGYTGLVYVSHPTTPGELQFVCAAR